MTTHIVLNEEENKKNTIIEKKIKIALNEAMFAKNFIMTQVFLKLTISPKQRKEGLVVSGKKQK